MQPTPSRAKRRPARLPRCLGCGFVAAARTEYCPECGLRHPRGRMEPMVKPFLPERAATCLRTQSQQIEEQQASALGDLARLGELLSNLRQRIRDAAGRDTRLLVASADAVQAAIDQRTELIARLRALQADIALDRIESEIALLGEQLLEPGGVQPVLVGTFDEHAGQGAVRLLHAHPSAGLVACVFERGPVRLLDLDALRWGGELGADCATVVAIAFASLHQMVALAHRDGTVSLWDHGSSRMLGRVSCASAPPVGLGWHPGAQKLGVACADGSVLTWAIPSLSPLGALRAPCGLSAFAIDPHGGWMAVGCDDRQVRLLDPHGGSTLRTLQGLAGRVLALAVEARGRWIAAQDDTGEARVWGQDATQSFGLSSRRSTRAAVCFSPGGQTVAFTSGLRVLVCQHQRGGAFELTDPDSSAPGSVATSIDGRWLLVGDARGWVRLWDARLDPAPWRVRDLIGAPLAALRAAPHAPADRLTRARDNVVAIAIDRLAELCDEIDVFHPQVASIGKEIDWLLAQLRQDTEAGELSPELMRRLRIELPLRPLERSLLAVEEQAAALLHDLGGADEAACDAMMEQARACHGKIERVVAALEAFAPGDRARIGREAAELAATICTLGDRIAARQATLAVQGVSPIEDHAVIERMRSTRLDVAPAERHARELRKLSSRKLRAVCAIARLDGRESLLRDASEALDRLKVELDAIQDVKKLRS